MPTFTFRDEFVKCGRKGCKSCPHGPYRYKYWKDGGKLRKKYMGKPEAMPVVLIDSEADWQSHQADCASIQSDALIFVLSRKSFVSCRSRYRAALRATVRDGDSDGGVELRRLWEEAWGSRR